eukprot:6195406-Pleurochrysis_carterae.AAC.1
MVDTKSFLDMRLQSNANIAHDSPSHVYNSNQKGLVLYARRNARVPSYFARLLRGGFPSPPLRKSGVWRQFPRNNTDKVRFFLFAVPVAPGVGIGIYRHRTLSLRRTRRASHAGSTFGCRSCSESPISSSSAAAHSAPAAAFSFGVPRRSFRTRSLVNYHIYSR